MILLVKTRLDGGTADGKRRYREACTISCVSESACWVRQAHQLFHGNAAVTISPMLGVHLCTPPSIVISATCVLFLHRR